MNLLTAKTSAKSSAKDSKTSMKKTRQLPKTNKVSKAKNLKSDDVVVSKHTTEFMSKRTHETHDFAPKHTVEQTKVATSSVAPSHNSGPAPRAEEIEAPLNIFNVKTMLISQKKDILNKSHEFRAAQTDRPHVSEEAEAASLDMNHSLSIHLHERDRSALYMIEKALSKITDGTYGICEGCGAQISARRLSARPFTPICIDCAEEQESRLN